MKMDNFSLYPYDQTSKLVSEDQLTYAVFNFVNFHNIDKEGMDDGMGCKLSYSSDRFHHPIKLVFSATGEQNLVGQVECDQHYFSEYNIENLIKDINAYLSELMLLSYE